MNNPTTDVDGVVGITRDGAVEATESTVSAHPIPGEATLDDHTLDDDTLIEEISIDGMCGVY